MFGGEHRLYSDWPLVSTLPHGYKASPRGAFSFLQLQDYLKDEIIGPLELRALMKQF